MVLLVIYKQREVLPYLGSIGPVHDSEEIVFQKLPLQCSYSQLIVSLPSNQGKCLEVGVDPHFTKKSTPTSGCFFIVRSGHTLLHSAATSPRFLVHSFLVLQCFSQISCCCTVSPRLLIIQSYLEEIICA